MWPPLYNQSPLPPKFTPTLLARGDRNCVIILATLLKCNTNWSRTIKYISLYKQRNQCYFASKNFWSNWHRSLNSSVAKVPLYKLGFMKTKIHVDGTRKWDVFHLQWPQMKLMKAIDRTMPLLDIFNEEYIKVKSQLKPIKQVREKCEKLACYEFYISVYKLVCFTVFV